MGSIITVENLSKKYTIGHQRYGGYQTFRDTLSHGVSSVYQRLRHPFSPNSEEVETEEFWALKDINFEVKQGDRLGIIGRNGAGKSTLLKILSRITHPTTGRVHIKGRVASLLEVGTGFHPELTGRENIFLNGAILGMTKSDIKKSFDEIVAFAEVEKFLDTPVKRYSSGMYVRLAFAVAAHLEPEILIVDEVLAVGDAAFQKKCMGQMQQISKEGRTVLFVSHNMGAITNLCSSALLLSNGELKKNGKTNEIISSYLNDEELKQKNYFSRESDKTIPIGLLEARLLANNNQNSCCLSRNEPINVQIKYEINKKILSVHLYSSIIAADGTVVFGTGDADIDKSRFGIRRPGVYTCLYTIPPTILNEGDYSISISLGIPYQVNYQENNHVLRFSITDYVSSGRSIHNRRAGAIWLDIKWRYNNNSPFL